MRNDTQIIDLKPLKLDELEPFYKWLNDEVVIKYSLSKFKKLNTRQEIQKWYLGLFEEADVLYKRIIRGGIPAFLSETDPYRNFLRLYETRTAIYDNIADIKVFSAGLNVTF